MFYQQNYSLQTLQPTDRPALLFSLDSIRVVPMELLLPTPDKQFTEAPRGSAEGTQRRTFIITWHQPKVMIWHNLWIDSDEWIQITWGFGWMTDRCQISSMVPLSLSSVFIPISITCRIRTRISSGVILLSMLHRILNIFWVVSS